VALLMVCALMPSGLQASAWNQEPGRGQLIVTSSLFRTSSSYDNSGTPQAFGYKGRFQQIELNPYLEYGLSHRYTLVVNAFVPALNFTNSYGSQSSFGLGNIEVGLQRRLNSVESPWAISGQITVSFPGYSATQNPPPGNHQEDLEARVLVGRGATKLHRQVFWDAEAAYRYRSGAPADQFRSDLTAGIYATHRLMVMGQFFGITGLRNGTPINLITNPNAQSDFDLYKAQLSLVARVTPRTRVQVGCNVALAGRNTGRGPTFILALWRSF
jgi:hypothetical protein